MIEIHEMPIAGLKLPKDYIADESQILSLMESIREKGLMHPIIVRSDGTIVAGGKRYCACQKLGWDNITCSVVPPDTSDKDCEILSLHENLKRFNLQWYDQVIMEKKLHDLRQEQHGIGKKGKKSGWSIRDTAKELGMSLGSLSEDIRMAEAILNDPLLRKIEDKTTARRVILILQKRANQELESSYEASCEINTVIHGDSSIVLRAYPNDTFDACLTDPPWLEFKKDEKLMRDACTIDVFPEIYRVLKPNTFLVMFVSTQDWIAYQHDLVEIGFQVQKYPLIWVKEGVLTYGTRSWEYQRDFEPLIVAVKGSPALSQHMLSAVFSCKIVPSAKLIHPNEKPIEVITKFLGDISYPDSIILDPFAGSGVVAQVCKSTGRRYVAIERDPTFYVKILERLKSHEIIGTQ